MGRMKLGLVMAGTLLVSVAAVPAIAEEVKTEAVITSVDGNTINARTTAGPLTVVLTPETKIVQTSGLARRRTGALPSPPRPGPSSSSRSYGRPSSKARNM